MVKFKESMHVHPWRLLKNVKISVGAKYFRENTLTHHTHHYLIFMSPTTHARGFLISWPAGMRSLSVVSR